jgi:protease-4
MNNLKLGKFSLTAVFKPVGKILNRLNPLRAVRRALFGFGNWRRRRFSKIDYVMLTLPSSIPPLPEERGWLLRRIQGPPPLSLTDLDRAFERLADDPRPKGVILYLRGFAMPLADLQTLRNSLLRLRQRGKRVVCFALGYDNATYYVASASDEIIVQPGGEVATLGLLQQATFLKDALETIGVGLDVVAISPYKSAYDQFSQADITPEARQQLEWLLDSRYEMLLQGISEGRKTTVQNVAAMIDTAPHTDEAALKAGYVDAVMNEEGLAAHLGVKYLVPWQRADKVLLRKWRNPPDRYVALLRVEGLMLPGESGKPPIEPPISVPFVGDQRAGDLTVTRQVRHLMEDKNAAAVILFIDSGGGAAAVAEAMTAALDELAKDRPLVVYMNAIAGSGGYYVATPARWIVAQPATITGSIGVITAKPITAAFWEKVRAHRVELWRGANATLLSDAAPFSDEQRQMMRRSVERLYQQFVARVAKSRHMTEAQVDAVSGGRVWTGAQAKANGLVDELGDLRAALAKARQLANLPDDAPLVMIPDRHKPIAPQLAEQANPAAALRYMSDNLKAVFNGTAQLLTSVWIE